MRTLILAVLFLFAVPVFSQTKADTTKAKPPQSIILNLDKLDASFKKDQADLTEANKQIEAWTATRNQVIGRMQAKQEVASDTTLQIQKPKK
jgi:uncharacterized protein YcfL